MIIAPPGLDARIKVSDTPTGWHYLRVIGFDDEGRALVVGIKGDIVPASQVPGFDCLTDTGPGHDDYAAIMPSGGWRIESTCDDGSVEDMPLAGWALKGGCVVPLTADSGGIVDDLELFGGKYRIYHPDTTHAPAPRSLNPGSDARALARAYLAEDATAQTAILGAYDGDLVPLVEALTRLALAILADPPR